MVLISKSAVRLTIVPRQCRCRFQSSKTNQEVSTKLREVMRNVAQPVAIAVAPTPLSSKGSKPGYHGATLSSLTSLTLHPQPLIAFSLRLPSRLAECLRISTSPSNKTAPGPLGTLTISLLSSKHAETANKLSQPLHPDDNDFFNDLSLWDSSSPPGLNESIGRLKCEVISSILLKDLPFGLSDLPSDTVDDGRGVEMDGKVETGEINEIIHHGSELFICRVVEVNAGNGRGDSLLYHQQKYITVKGEEGSQS